VDTFEVVGASVEAPAVCCPTMGGMLSGLLLMAQRLFAVLCAPTLPGGMVAGVLLTDVPPVEVMGLRRDGISVAGSCSGISCPPLDWLPGDAVISREPHMGHTMSEHETLEG